MEQHSADLFTVPADREIIASRKISAPRSEVYAAWTDPAVLQQWWGPAGFTNTFHEHDLRPGGAWRFTMHGPDKGHYENAVTFLAVGPPALLVWDRITPPLFRMVVTFDEAGTEQTVVTFRMQFDTAAACAKLRPYVTDKNEENFDRLEKVLGS